MRSYSWEKWEGAGRAFGSFYENPRKRGRTGGMVRKSTKGRPEMVNRQAARELRDQAENNSVSHHSYIVTEALTDTI